MNNTFQTIILGLFAVGLIGGVVTLALFKNSNKEGSGVPVVIWGTTSESQFNLLTNQLFSSSKGLSVSYKEKDEASFDQDVIEALASGKGPDVILLSHDSILRYKDKIAPISFKTFSERDFKNTFVSLGEMYLTPAGALGVPFSIDPLVLYWNRSLFSNAGLATPPAYWDEFASLNAKLTKKDKVLNITQSLAALGESANIPHAKEILSALFLQTGNPIAQRGAAGLESALADNKAVSALNFYTEFANPLKPFYSWNRSMPSSKDFFLSGDLAMYFGFASELPDIRLKNPNLNFAIAPIPQSKDADRVTTFGKMVALAIPKNSKNIVAAYQVALKLTDASSIAALSTITNLPPVRRDLLTTRPSEAFLSIFYDGAVQAKAWIAPEPVQLTPIFKEMVESLTAGRAGVSGAVSKANSQLDQLLK